MCNIDSLRDGTSIQYTEGKDTDFHCCAACADAFNGNADNGMKLKILPGYENEPCGMFGCTVKGVAHKYRVYTDGAFNIIACFDHGIARAIWHFHGPQNGVLYIDCFKNDRPFCMTTDEKGWTVEIVNDDPSDKTMYAFGSRLKVLSPEQNIEKKDVFDCSHPICDSGPLRLHTAEVNMCPSCVRSHTKDGYTDYVPHDNYFGKYSVYCVSCNEYYGKRIKLTRYNYPITQLEPIGNTQWCEPRLKLSTKRKADEEATDTEDDSDRDTKRIKKSNLTRMNADSEMHCLLRCNVEAREKKQEECGTVGDIDLLHLCYGCKQDALNEKAFELSCYPFPFDDNEYKYYACEREGCRTAEVGCGNLVTRA